MHHWYLSRSTNSVLSTKWPPLPRLHLPICIYDPLPPPQDKHHQCWCPATHRQLSWQESSQPSCVPFPLSSAQLSPSHLALVHIPSPASGWLPPLGAFGDLLLTLGLCVFCPPPPGASGHCPSVSPGSHARHSAMSHQQPRRTYTNWTWCIKGGKAISYLVCS